jgi:hypothetical protein
MGQNTGNARQELIMDSSCTQTDTNAEHNDVHKCENKDNIDRYSKGRREKVKK